MKNKLVFLFIFALAFSVHFIKPTSSYAQACDPNNANSCPANMFCNPFTLQCAITAQEAANQVKAKSAQQYHLEGEDPNGITGVLPIVQAFPANAITGVGSATGVGAMSQLWAMTGTLYQDRPVSTTYYVAYLKQNLNFGVKPAYAQGFGFNALNPIIPIWALTRNIALGGFVILFVIIGFMIMLRSRIDARTVVTIQQALPKIIICLILVIFSYPLVGFLVDITTLITRIGASTLQSASYLAADQPNATTALDDLLSKNVFELYEPLYNVDALIAQLLNLDASINRVGQILQIDAFLGGGLTRSVLWIAMFVAVIRVFFMLLTAYLTIVIMTITAPFRFLMMAIPGSQSTPEGFIRTVMSNLLVFPAVFFMLSLAAIFYSNPGNPASSQYNGPGDVWNVGQTTFAFGTAAWTPPALGNWGGLIGPLLTIAILLTTPKAGAIVKEAVDPKTRNPADGAVTEAIQKASARIPMLGSFTRA